MTILRKWQRDQVPTAAVCQATFLFNILPKSRKLLKRTKVADVLGCRVEFALPYVINAFCYVFHIHLIVLSKIDSVQIFRDLKNAVWTQPRINMRSAAKLGRQAWFRGGFTEIAVKFTNTPAKAASFAGLCIQNCRDTICTAEIGRTWKQVWQSH